MRALPPVARAVSSNPEAYVYLAESIRAWPDQAEPGRSSCSRAGWRSVAWRNLSGGIVALHRAIAPPAAHLVDAAEGLHRCCDHLAVGPSVELASGIAHGEADQRRCCRRRPRCRTSRGSAPEGCRQPDHVRADIPELPVEAQDDLLHAARPHESDRVAHSCRKPGDEVDDASPHHRQRHCDHDPISPGSRRRCRTGSVGCASRRCAPGVPVRIRSPRAEVFGQPVVAAPDECVATAYPPPLVEPGEVEGVGIVCVLVLDLPAERETLDLVPREVRARPGPRRAACPG